MREYGAESPAADDELGLEPGLELDHEELNLEDLFAMLSEDLEAAVASTLAERSPVPARELTAQVIDTDLSVAVEDTDAAALGQSVAFLVLTTWITSLRAEWCDDNADGRAVDWVGRELGSACAEVAHLVATAHTDQDTQRVSGELGEDFLPGLVWLTTGLLAEYADGDVGLLRRSRGR